MCKLWKRKKIGRERERERMCLLVCVKEREREEFIVHDVRKFVTSDRR